MATNEESDINDVTSEENDGDRWRHRRHWCRSWLETSDNEEDFLMLKWKWPIYDNSSDSDLTQSTLEEEKVPVNESAYTTEQVPFASSKRGRPKLSSSDRSNHRQLRSQEPSLRYTRRTIAAKNITDSGVHVHNTFTIKSKSFSLLKI